MDSSHNTISQAVILAAGFGTRLRPLTDNIPKAMVSLGGKPLLLRHIEQLKKYGITEIYINLHYLPDVITEYFGDGSKFGVTITYALETPDILGTAGGIKNFENSLRDNFFVVYADIFNIVDYQKMADSFFEKKDALGMEIVGDTHHPADSDLVRIDQEGRFVEVYKKPHEVLPESYHSMKALFIFNKRIFQFIPENKYFEIDHQVIPLALEAGENIYGYETEDYMKDIGTLERHSIAEQHIATLGEGDNY